GECLFSRHAAEIDFRAGYGGFDSNDAIHDFYSFCIALGGHTRNAALQRHEKKEFLTGSYVFDITCSKETSFLVSYSVSTSSVFSTGSESVNRLSPTECTKRPSWALTRITRFVSTTSS